MTDPSTTDPTTDVGTPTRRSGEILSVAPAPASPPPGFVHDVYTPSRPS
jgi:hypothetical protein